MNKQFKLSDYSLTFSTRVKASELCDKLRQFVLTLDDNDNLFIDFSDVEAVSYSFFDQLLSELLELESSLKKDITITGLSANITSVIDKSLKHRSYQYKPTRSERTLL